MNREKRKKDNSEIPTDYAGLLALVKDRVRSAQHAALKAVNTELIGLYWDIGRMIVERQDVEGWGKAVDTMSVAGQVSESYEECRKTEKGAICVSGGTKIPD